MANFYVRGILANLITLAILLACLFIPAGTLNYWQAWVFVAVFGVSAQALGIYFLVHDLPSPRTRAPTFEWQAGGAGLGPAWQSFLCLPRVQAVVPVLVPCTARLPEMLRIRLGLSSSLPLDPWPRTLIGFTPEHQGFAGPLFADSAEASLRPALQSHCRRN